MGNSPSQLLPNIYSTPRPSWIGDLACKRRGKKDIHSEPTTGIVLFFGPLPLLINLSVRVCCWVTRRRVCMFCILLCSSSNCAKNISETIRALSQGDQLSSSTSCYGDWEDNEGKGSFFSGRMQRLYAPSTSHNKAHGAEKGCCGGVHF